MIVNQAGAGALRGADVDVCIVGAGAAGITLACELDGHGLRVALLEAGGKAQDPRLTRDMYRGTASGAHPSPAEFRRIGLGGTTTVWGGRCVPYDPIDFEPREHVPNSGWPISHPEVAQHYPRALEYCHAGSDDFAVATALPGGAQTLPGLNDTGLLLDRIERYSLPTHFGRHHRQRLMQSRDVTVLLGARCVRLDRRTDGSIEGAEIADAADHRWRVRARAYVLATGALEATRLLFVSDPGGPGLGNEGDRLGRYYQCHFANVCARLDARRGSVAFDFERTRDGVYARRKLQFAADVQRRHQLLNTAFRLHFPGYSDASHGSGVLSSIYLLKSRLLPEYRHIVQHGAGAQVVSGTGAHLRNVVCDVPAIGRFGFDRLVRGTLARRKLPYTLVPPADGRYPLEFNSEQTPLATSRVTLNGDRDRHGVPGIHVDWRTGEQDCRAAMRAFRVLRDAIATTGTCTVEFDDASLEQSIRGSVPIVGHHIGTARMGASVQDGVVDRNCAVFGAPNLFVASSATFPTSSHANPTLTIVALAIRLAKHLRHAYATR